MSRRKIIEKNLPRHHDAIDTIDIGCSDRRIKGSRGEVGRFIGCPMAIPITIPGAIKDLVEPNHPRDREALLEKIALVSEGVTTIRARMHNACKACASRDDLDYYEDMLLKAETVLRARFPGVEVKLFIMDFDGYYLVWKDQVVAEMCSA